ncbi:hypothetical protein NUW54_g4440 [Trametes sanguinea]|uniref:Uncharacterized protein n=1 Tax=Trametes sanguinea TaxID=158606 RepID=A0ACC1Q1G4_9APHY|nr:hypothetical protein NUW54_g4440 [Trametes sanguinea]
MNSDFLPLTRLRMSMEVTIGGSLANDRRLQHSINLEYCRCASLAHASCLTGPRSVLTPPALGELHAVLALQTSYLRVFISISGLLLPPHITPATAPPASIPHAASVQCNHPTICTQSLLFTEPPSGCVPGVRVHVNLREGSPPSEALEEGTFPQHAQTASGA